MLYPHIPLGSRTFSSLRATCACSGRPPESRERLGLLRPGLKAVACRLLPASLSAVLEEPWLASRLSGRTRLTAKEEDHWEVDEEEEEEAFCDEMGRTWSESVDADRGELLFWKMEKHEWSYQLYTNMSIRQNQQAPNNPVCCRKKTIFEIFWFVLKLEGRPTKFSLKVTVSVKLQPLFEGRNEHWLYYRKSEVTQQCCTLRYVVRLSVAATVVTMCFLCPFCFVWLKTCLNRC